VGVLLSTSIFCFCSLPRFLLVWVFALSAHRGRTPPASFQPAAASCLLRGKVARSSVRTRFPLHRPGIGGLSEIPCSHSGFPARTGPRGAKDFSCPIFIRRRVRLPGVPTRAHLLPSFISFQLPPSTRFPTEARRGHRQSARNRLDSTRSLCQV
jgi:hypothetical protein